MSKPRYIERKFYYYRLNISDNSNLPFENIISIVNELDLKDRFKDIFDRENYLYRVSETSLSCKISNKESDIKKYDIHKFFVGVFIKCRNIDLQPRVKNNGETEDQILDDDEKGFAERSSFLYHPLTQILVFQVNKSGASIDNFTRYFELFMSDSLDGFKITAERILNLEAAKQINEAKHIRKFHVKIAGLDNPGELSSENSAISRVLNIANELNSPSINLEFSVEQKITSTLNTDLISSLVSSLMSMPIIGNMRDGKEIKKGVKSVEAVTASNGRGSSLLDMLGTLMFEKERIKIEYGENLSCLHLENAAINAWNKKQVEIFSMYFKE